MQVESETAEQREDSQIVGRDQHRVAADSGEHGALAEQGQELRGDSTAVPVVDDRDGEVGRRPIAGVPDVAGDADRAPIGQGERDEGFVVDVVDLGEVVQFCRGEFPLRGEEAEEPAAVAQPIEPVGKQRPVRRADRPDQHLGAVAERDDHSVGRVPAVTRRIARIKDRRSAVVDHGHRLSLPLTRGPI